MATNRRKLPGLIVHPRRQLTFMLIVGGGMLAVTLLIAVTLIAFNRSMTGLQAAYSLDPEVAAAVTSSINSSLTWTLVLSAALGVTTMINALRLSHRFYGPAVALRRHVDELAKGNYQSRVRLRSNDELMDLQDGLNTLAEALEKKTGGSASGG